MLADEAITDLLVPIFRPVLGLKQSKYQLMAIPTDLCIPATDYSTIEVMKIRQYGQQQACVIENVGQQLAADYELVIRVESFGKKAKFRVTSLVAQLRNYPSMCQKINETGLSHISESPVVDISHIDKTKHRGRAWVELRMNASTGDFKNMEGEDLTKIGFPGYPEFDESIQPVLNVPLNADHLTTNVKRFVIESTISSNNQP